MKLLVLGTGSIGTRHLRVLGGLAGVKVVAAPLRPERRAQLAAEGIDAVAPEAISGLSLDGAVVATDTGRHSSDAASLLERCPVLVEKPLAPTVEAGAGVIAASERTGRALRVACCMRFDPGLGWVRERLERLGRLHAADAECQSWLFDWRPGRNPLTSYAARPGEGGVLLDLIHEIDYCSWLLGPVRRVFGHLENRGLLGMQSEVEESARLLLDHGALVSTLRLSFAARPASRRLRIWGDEGLLEWDFLARAACLRDRAGRELDRFGWSAPEPMYRAQAEAWLASLAERDAGPLATGDDGLAAVAVCDAARASHRAGRWESIA